jgi:hypothetical protein
MHPTCTPPQCLDCGFAFSSAHRAASVSRIAAAGELFDDVLADLERSCGSGFVHERQSDGWTPIEHLLHVTEGLDTSRRRLFQMRLSQTKPSMSAGLLDDGDGAMSRHSAIRQLDDAALWLLRALAVMPPHRRHCEDVGQLLACAAHEITHHHRLVGGLLLIPESSTPAPAVPVDS